MDIEYKFERHNVDMYLPELNFPSKNQRNEVKFKATCLKNRLKRKKK